MKFLQHQAFSTVLLFAVTISASNARADQTITGILSVTPNGANPSLQIGVVPRADLNQGGLGIWRSDAPSFQEQGDAVLIKSFALQADPVSTTINPSALNGSIFLGQAFNWAEFNNGSSGPIILFKAPTLITADLTTTGSLDAGGRITTSQTSSLSAGIWYRDVDGTSRQFLGVKNHSSTGSLQEMGLWQASGWQFTFKGNGVASKPGGGSWAALSDARVKKNVIPYSAGLTELEQVRPVTYQYNGLGGTADDGHQFVGVIAQELEKVAPAMIGKSSEKLNKTDKKETEFKTVDPSAFTYMLINSVKELSAQNRELKAALCELNPVAKICSTL